jgi:hypothetical protein
VEGWGAWVAAAYQCVPLLLCAEQGRRAGQLDDLQARSGTHKVMRPSVVQQQSACSWLLCSCSTT